VHLAFSRAKISAFKCSENEMDMIDLLGALGSKTVIKNEKTRIAIEIMNLHLYPKHLSRSLAA